MLTRDEAAHVVYYISAVEECHGNHNRVLEKMTEDGYTEREIDAALKALGKIAGQDCGIL
jgi:hypothetical protein